LRQTLILLLAASAVFGASVAGSFHLDDYSLFSRDLWRPLEMRSLTYVTFWINEQLGGHNPIGYHAVNFALHLAAVALLFQALQRLIPRPAAFLSAAIFAVHPFVAEPVNYIFERSTILATIFCLAALLAWTRFLTVAAQYSKPSRDRKGAVWVTVWFAAALLCKEECVAFPLFLLLLNLARQGPMGLRPTDRNREYSERRGRPPSCPVKSAGGQVRDLPHVARAIGVMLAMSLAAGARVFVAGSAMRGSGVATQAGISAPAYLLTQGTVILRYLRMLVIPWGFTVDPDIPLATGTLAFLAWAVVIGLAWAASRRFSRLREGFWFLGGLVLLLPSSSIFPAADLAADRRMYLPLIALSVVLGLALSTVQPRAVAVAAIAILAVLSFVRTQVWRTEESLWTDAAAKAPRKVRPKIQLARAMGGARGLAILEQANSIAPDDPRIASEQGSIAISMSNPQQALADFGRALALEPGSAMAHNNRGVALVMLGQKEAARSDFERALSIDPCQFDARLNLLRLGAAAPGSGGCQFTHQQQAELGLLPLQPQVKELIH